MNRFILPFMFFCSSIFLLGSCNSGSEETVLDVPPIVNNPDNPELIHLRITDQVKADTSYLYTVKGTFEGDTVGLIISLDQTIASGIMEDGTVNEEDGFSVGSIKFISSGTESDRFIAALAKLWGAEAGLARTTFSSDPVIPMTFSSNMDPVDHDKPSTNNFKLFFDPQSDEPGEAFFTVDTYRKVVELQEKDPEYRLSILQALTGTSSVTEEESTL